MTPRTLRVIKTGLSNLAILGPLRNLLVRVSTLRKIPKESGIVENSFFAASNDSDISDHLSFLFSVCLAKRPNTILELGTRGGESTRVFQAYCRIYSKKGISVDLDPAPSWLNSEFWTHFESDDLLIGERLHTKGEWPDSSKLEPLDLIFLDSSHEYEHTLNEIKLFWPLLKPGGVFLFHDTNLTDSMTRKISGNPNVGWDNKAGVSRAIEDFFGTKINWQTLVSVGQSGSDPHAFSGLSHFPWNNGMTIISKK